MQIGKIDIINLRKYNSHNANVKFANGEMEKYRQKQHLIFLNRRFL